MNIHLLHQSSGECSRNNQFYGHQHINYYLLLAINNQNLLTRIIAVFERAVDALSLNSLNFVATWTMIMFELDRLLTVEYDIILY